jgi:hypothetical protein
LRVEVDIQHASHFRFKNDRRGALDRHAFERDTQIENFTYGLLVERCDVRALAGFDGDEALDSGERSASRNGVLLTFHAV